MEDFVTFEIAKKLKEKGYPQRTFGEYDMLGACYIEDGRFYENGCITEVTSAYTSPTISQVLKWLREEKKIHICIGYSDNINAMWNYEVILLEGALYQNADSGYETYEQAALAGIEYVLDNLI